MVESKPKTSIIYLGTRGGPVRQINQLLAVATIQNINFTWFLSSNIQGLVETDASFSQKIIEVKMPKSKIGILIRLGHRRGTINFILNELKNQGINRVFLLMLHPWELKLAKKIFQETEIEVWRAVHDLVPHPGDKWPTKKAISISLKYAHKYVTFSKHIYEKLMSFNKPVLLTEIYEPQRKSVNSAKSGSVLFVGRIRKYKGLDLLKASWGLVTNSEKSLTVAGEGKGIPFENQAGINICNRWLSDQEIESLIEQHKVLVLPYIEASQSGLISIAHSKGVPVVVTPVGGLSTQISDGVNGVISRDLTPESLATAIDKALNFEWKIVVSKENPLKNFLENLANHK